MSSGFRGSDLNQLKDKDDIEDDDPVNLVGTRSSDPSDAPLITEEMQYLSGNQRPGGLIPSKNATKILPPTMGRINALGPQPGNSLYISQGNTPSRKRGPPGPPAPDAGGDVRPSKQTKLSVIEIASVDTDDEYMDDPYDRGDKPIQRQQVRKPKETTTRQGSRHSKPRQINTGPEQETGRKNGAIGSSTRLAGGKSIGRADSNFISDVNNLSTGRRPTQSTHAGALQNNNSSKWNSSSSRDGDIRHTKWTGGTKPQIIIPQQQRQKSGLSVTKLDLLCFQHGLTSLSIGEDAQSLSVEAVPGKSLTVLCGEKRIWGINLEDIRCIRSVHVNTLRKVFAIRIGPRSLGGSEGALSLGEPNRAVVFTLKHNKDVDQCKIGLFKESVKFTPKEEEEKFFDKIANSLGDWKDREDVESRRVALEVSRQKNSHQGKAQGLTPQIRRSMRNKTDKKELMEILPSRRSRGSSTDEFEDSPGSSEMLKLELPNPRWETSLVYPPNGPKREVVDYDDLSRLNSNQFLNDNIVNFYLRYIEVQLQKRNPGLAKETHFLNTFFYERLTKRDEKGKRREISSVLKWTAKVDIFKTSYIIVPINESSHWYLAVICNLCHLERKMKDKVLDSPESIPTDLEYNGNLAEVKEDDQDMVLSNTSDAEVIAESSILCDGEEQHIEIFGSRGSLEHMAIDEEQPNEIENPESHSKNVDEHNHREIIELDNSPSQRLKSKGRGKSKAKEKSSQNRKNYIAPDTPAIIILDSMGFGTSTRASTIRNLREYLVAEAQNKRNLEITKEDIKATYAKAPNQNNWYDCGLFLLHYVERFLDRPKEFAAMFLAKEVNMRDQELWRTEDIGGMREKLFYLFVKLHEEQEAVEIEQKDFKKAGSVNANGAKGQKVGNREGYVKDVDAEGSAKDTDVRKISIDPEQTVASKDQLNEFEHQLVSRPTKLLTQLEMSSINPEEVEVEVEVEEVPNSMLQHRKVTLSVRNNQ